MNLDELTSTPAKGADSTSELRVVATSDPKVEPDIVVEGPDIFQAGREEGSRCAWGNKPWVQTTAEPSMFFNAWEWCRHEDDPVMRLETGLAHFNQDLVYDPKEDDVRVVAVRHDARVAHARHAVRSAQGVSG